MMTGLPPRRYWAHYHFGHWSGDDDGDRGNEQGLVDRRSVLGPSRVAADAWCLHLLRGGAADCDCHYRRRGECLENVGDGRPSVGREKDHQSYACRHPFRSLCQLLPTTAPQTARGTKLCRPRVLLLPHQQQQQQYYRPKCCRTLCAEGTPHEVTP